MPEIVYRKVKELKLHVRNPRQIAEGDFSVLCQSIEKHPDYFEGRPILLSDRTGELVVIAGNMRLRASKKIGLKEVPTMLLPALTEEREREIVIRDNVNNGSWDFDVLGADYEWTELQDWGLTFPDLTDITEVEPAGDADAEPQIDKAAELNKKWGVVSGDLWQIGEHRLLCGDSTKREDVERLMDGQKAELLFTSPPYSDMRTYEGDKQLSTTHLANFLDVWADCSSFLAVNLGLQFKDAEVVSYWDDYLAKAREVGLKLLAWNVWDKTQAGSVAQATNMFLLTHEWIFVFGSGRKRLNRTIPNQLDKYEAIHGKDWQKGSKRTVRQQDGSMASTTTAAYTHHQLHSVIQQTPELSDLRKNHPAMFPVGLPTSYISAMTQAGDIVTESFCGSGTTMIACENLNRRCYGMELSVNYCAVILERMATAFPELEIKRIDG